MEGLRRGREKKWEGGEDVRGRGGSAIKAESRLGEVGYVVERFVAIVERQEDKEADEFMESANLELRSLFTLDEICQEWISKLN